MNKDNQAYPLAWPPGWPTTPPGLRKPGNEFGKMQQRPGESWRSKARLTPDAARKSLREELSRLGAKNPIISSNVPVRQDGEMRADAADRRIAEPGIAIYFELKGKPMTMARDAYDNVAANMRSLALAIEYLRGLERHGGSTMMERAFEGFAALPPPDGAKPKRPWWVVLNYSANEEDRADLSAEEIDARFRTLAKKRHPDVAGDNGDAMAELNEAREEAKRAVGG